MTSELSNSRVASVPVRAEVNRTARKSFFPFGPDERKWGESKNSEEAGWGGEISHAPFFTRPDCGPI